jgi:hypothetical protein
MKLPFLFLSFWLVALGAMLAQDEPVIQSDPPPAEEMNKEDSPVEEITEGTEPTDGNPPEDEVAIPAPYDISRYQGTWEKNPFTLKTKAVAQATVNWAQDWALAGMYNYAGKIRVSIRNKQTSEFKHISNQGKPDDEFRFIDANFNRNRSEASAKIAKGTEEAELKYDDSTAAQPITINNTMRPAGGTQGGVPPAGSGLNQGNPMAQGGVLNGGMGRPGQPALTRPAAGSTNGRVFNAPGLPNGVAAPQGNMQGSTTNGLQGASPTGVPMGGGLINAGNPSAQGAVTPPTISRRRQLIPAPVIPAQP